MNPSEIQQYLHSIEDDRTSEVNRARFIRILREYALDVGTSPEHRGRITAEFRRMASDPIVLNSMSDSLRERLLDAAGAVEHPTEVHADRREADHKKARSDRGFGIALATFIVVGGAVAILLGSGGQRAPSGDGAAVIPPTGGGEHQPALATQGDVLVSTGTVANFDLTPGVERDVKYSALRPAKVRFEASCSGGPPVQISLLARWFPRRVLMRGAGSLEVDLVKGEAGLSVSIPGSAGSAQCTLSATEIGPSQMDWISEHDRRCDEFGAATGNDLRRRELADQQSAMLSTKSIAGFPAMFVNVESDRVPGTSDTVAIATFRAAGTGSGVRLRSHAILNPATVAPVLSRLNQDDCVLLSGRFLLNPIERRSLNDRACNFEFDFQASRIDACPMAAASATVAPTQPLQSDRSPSTSSPGTALPSSVRVAVLGMDVGWGSDMGRLEALSPTGTTAAVTDCRSGLLGVRHVRLSGGALAGERGSFNFDLTGGGLFEVYLQSTEDLASVRSRIQAVMGSSTPKMEGERLVWTTDETRIALRQRPEFTAVVVENPERAAQYHTARVQRCE